MNWVRGKINFSTIEKSHCFVIGHARDSKVNKEFKESEEENSFVSGVKFRMLDSAINHCKLH